MNGTCDVLYEQVVPVSGQEKDFLSAEWQSLGIYVLSIIHWVNFNWMAYFNKLLGQVHKKLKSDKGRA